MDTINRKKPQFKVGDKYIRMSKYGTITTGKILRITPTKVIYTVNINGENKKYIYTKYSIVNDNGICYEIDGSDGLFYKLDEVNIY
jgi:hypothetical protein